ncbi:hypothetical protein NDS46_13605 [Paenibacillus thiaminolyticus]|uniref:hypothetical protein n=1 Tax=Paenibacillus thiaminolyticus TaxID=49283 RepID=UPI00232F5813|nr:hypothetical protein [Paenibacillus thiaminolyticus]WCF10811.1 hypothetical protein NDS46_13605 [Paenibacillus thiaminolyticus]
MFAKEVSADQSVRIYRDYVRSFFDHYLLGKKAPLLTARRRGIPRQSSIRS